MAVKVVKNRIFDGSKTYEVGEIIMGLSEKEESQLVSNGIVEYVAEYVQQDSVKIDTSEDAKLNDDEQKTSGDGEVDTGKLDAADDEDKKEPSETELDPNSLAINTDDYVKESAVKNKKGKSV